MKPRTIEEWVTYIQTAPRRLRNATAQVKVREQGIDRYPAQTTHASDVPASPILILGAITLGLPALALILVVGMNSGVREGSLLTILTFLVISAFVIAAIFEIKRLADQSADPDHR
ncbi:hypothetical protein [Microvirga pakistanensis]|uniref:hypothetical protein n=1 Tax=Microvirga pakistanensis TaxID=1682650 RepID=UPI00106BBDFE|nr:hypothetical protein [Microvirga pakistanensis]